MDKESAYLLQKINKHKLFNPQTKMFFGTCKYKNIDISFIPDICQLETQKCFRHRKDKNGNF